MITQGELRNLIEYNPETGLWRWRSYKVNRNMEWFAGALTSNGYLTFRVDGKTYYAHTLAWLYVYGDWFLNLDHKNRDKADNRIDNLRQSSKSTNTINSKVREDNSSGHVGISYIGGNRRKVWHAYINQNGFRRSARFETMEEAVAWRRKVQVELFGQFVPKVVSSDK